MSKRVVVAVSGGIAAYKIPILIRLLRKGDCQVKVIVTKNALNFVTLQTLQTLSENTVYSDMFSVYNEHSTEHISIAQWADVFVVAPATANVIGKYANAIADDCLTTSLLAFDKQVFLAPAMNSNMYNNPGVKANIETLKKRGVRVISPQTGHLACGTKGEGRMAEAEHIYGVLRDYLSQSLVFKGKTVCITAGPTYEQIDAVRFVGNYSSGRMGFALAEAFAEKGAHVKLIAGPVSLQAVHENIERTDVKSARQMYDETLKAFESSDIAVLSAAVADYRPKKTSDSKLKKSDRTLILELEPTEDILAELGRRKRENQLLVGFALETDNELDNAKEKLRKKNLDFIVMNSLRDKGAGFGTPTNKVTIVDSFDNVYATDLLPKEEIAEEIVKKVISFLN